ncbi:MAG: hypothetical protein U0Y82_10490 [Thermoleophilia bacterium]
MPVRSGCPGARRRRLLPAAGAAAVTATALLMAWPAAAVPPTTTTSTVNTTRRSTSVSNACGTDVYLHLQGTLTVRLFRDQAGLVVHEDDISSDLTGTWSAPALGTSFSYRISGPNQWDYPGGATIGSPAVFKSTGRGDKVPGASADAGQALETGTVDAFTPEGIPLVSLEEIVKFTGSPNGATPAIVCAPLR